MKIHALLALSLAITPISASAESPAYTCSTNSQGKAIVKDSNRPGKVFAVATLRNGLSAKIKSLKQQQSSIKSNKKLSSAKKSAQLAAVKTKLTDATAALALVKSCKDSTSGGATTVRTQLLVDTGRCYGAPFNDCDFHGSLLVQASSSLCAQQRTIVVIKDGSITLGQSVTSATTVTGTWSVDGQNYGAGTYTVELQERVVEKVTCLAAKNTYTVGGSGEAVLVKQEY